MRGVGSSAILLGGGVRFFLRAGILLVLSYTKLWLLPSCRGCLQVDRRWFCCLF